MRNALCSFTTLVERLSICLFVTMIFMSASYGQTQITTGTIEGTVTDERGAFLPGASVEIKNIDTNFSRTVVTDEDGRFVALALPPGNYTLTVTKQGFSTLVAEKARLTVGQAMSLQLSMTVSGVEGRVTITAAPTIDTTRTESATTLDENAINTTPILGRKF